MKFYLSSYKVGNETDKLKAMIPADNKKTAYISNALDFSNDAERRKQSEQSDIEQLKPFGLDVELLDLRDYFGKKTELEKKIAELSGLDDILKDLLKKDDILYGGYSAGVCVLAPTLKGMELVDDPNVKPYDSQKETIWDGVGILDYTILPHYKSDHPESGKVDETVEYMTKNKIPFKTLRDGKVIIIE